MKMQRKSNQGSIEDDLRNWLSDAQRVAIAGIGNSLRKDDFVGVKIARSLRNRVSQSVYLVECETVPESFIEPIIGFEPTHVLIIDAALLDVEPGFSKIIELGRIAAIPSVSTHVLPLQIFCAYLARTTRAKIALLAIEPQDTSFGEGLTSELRKTAKHLTIVLSKILP